MPELSDLLKLRHLIWQASDVSICGTLHAVLGHVSCPESFEEFKARKYTSFELGLIRKLYDQLRRVERRDHMPEIMVRQYQERLKERYLLEPP